jgi:hypothetical protein
MRTYSYFELKRDKVYLCNLDHPKYQGKFEYKLHKHYLVYRKRDGEWCYDTGKVKKSWRGVWNIKWYDEQQAQFLPVEMTHKAPV